MQIVRLEGRVPWRSFLDRSSGQWIAICKPLKLTVQAETWGELNESIRETLDAIFRDLLVSGDLKKFLREQGWQPMTPIPTRPEGVRFDIPWKIIEQATPDSQTAVH